MSEQPIKIQVPDGAPRDDEQSREQIAPADFQARGNRKRTVLFVALVAIAVIAIACGVTFGLVAGKSGGGGDDAVPAFSDNASPPPGALAVQQQAQAFPGGAQSSSPEANAVTNPLVASVPAATPVDSDVSRGEQQPTTQPIGTGDPWLIDPGEASSGCDEDALSSSVSELPGLASPVFVVGDTDVLELIDSELESAATGSSNHQVFLPQVVCAGADEPVDELGALSGVEACSSLDFLKNSNVLAFGIHKTGVAKDTSFCAAFNPYTGTVGIAQSGILPEVTVAGILTLSFDSVGFSLDKGLSSTTGNKMWNNTGEPAFIDVSGHVFVQGTGIIGFKATEKIEVGIVIEATLLVDADYKNDGLGLVQVFREKDAVDFPDFALLLSGYAYPKFNVTTVLKDGGQLKKEIDLSEAITANVDIFTIVEQGKSSLQLATSIDVYLKGICDASFYLQILCEIFDENSEISGSVKSFVNPNGFGIMWAVSGFIGLKSDFLELLLGWPDEGIEFDAELSLTMNDDALRVCARAEAEGEKTCWGFCTKDSQCDSDQFCDALGACIWKKNVGGSCLKSSGCKSEICKTGFCSECSQLDTTSECPSDQYCGTLFPVKLGLRCLPKLGIGAPCSSNAPCNSGICKTGFCSECSQLDTSECPSGQYCGTLFPSLVGLRCHPKLDVGAPCSSNVPCKSGICKTGFCSECSQLDTTSECPSGQYCGTLFPSLVGLRCRPQLDVGTACSSDAPCKSGICKTGFCSECPTLDSDLGCPSGQFCGTQFPRLIGLRCENKRARGSLCSNDVACQSGDCGLVFCK